MSEETLGLFGAEEPDDPRQEPTAQAPAADAPLAERMRPRTLDEVVGQDPIAGAEGTLRRMLAADHLPSMVLHGPPGTGKTTIARLLAHERSARFVSLSAVSEGVPRMREVMKEAEVHRSRGRSTLLFVDEIHRLSKSQQDFLLPFVESGLVTLVGATTEHPSFEVIPALLSRARVVVLHPLGRDALAELLDRAGDDPERGLGGSGVTLTGEARELLVGTAGGDARRMLGALETAARLAGRGGRVDEALAREALQRPTARFDVSLGYEILSAFHKSLRSSRGDAALYWAARLIEGGEDPLVVFRRLVAAAYEDVGLADPNAGVVAVQAMQAYERLGAPEGFLPLANAILYVARAPKSNRAYRALGEARQAAREHPDAPVPIHLRNAPTSLMKEWGYGEGYRYAHDFPDADPGLECMPDVLVGRVFYEPSGRGDEAGEGMEGEGEGS